MAVWSAGATAGVAGQWRGRLRAGWCGVDEGSRWGALHDLSHAAQLIPGGLSGEPGHFHEDLRHLHFLLLSSSSYFLDKFQPDLPCHWCLFFWEKWDPALGWDGSLAWEFWGPESHGQIWGCLCLPEAHLSQPPKWSRFSLARQNGWQCFWSKSVAKKPLGPASASSALPKDPKNGTSPSRSRGAGGLVFGDTLVGKRW